MGQVIRNPSATFPMLRKLSLRSQHFGYPADEGEFFPFQQGGRAFLAIEFCQLWLVVPGVNLRLSTIHKKPDDALGFCALFGRDDLIGSGFIRKDSGERQRAKARTSRLQKVSARWCTDKVGNTLKCHLRITSGCGRLHHRRTKQRLVMSLPKAVHHRALPQGTSIC